MTKHTSLLSYKNDTGTWGRSHKTFYSSLMLRQYAKVFIPGKSFHPSHILVNKAKSDKHCEYFTQDCFTLSRKYVTTLKKCQGQRLRLILPEQR